MKKNINCKLSLKKKKLSCFVILVFLLLLLNKIVWQYEIMWMKNVVLQFINENRVHFNVCFSKYRENKVK